jgi:hypothetical protein
MTYLKGSPAQASDYNALAGLTGTAAGSSAAATQVAGYLLGIGYGDRGYGQTSTTLTAVSAGSVITGNPWLNLRTAINTIATWQNAATTQLPSAAEMSSGAVHFAAVGGTPYSIPGLLTTLDTNRHTYQIGNMTLTSSAATTTRSTTWGAGGGSITCEFSVTFADEQAARYFFNTGGDIRIALAHPSTLTTRDSSWNTILSSLVVAFKANSSTRLTGSYGTAQSVGYYQLTTSYQTILDGTNSGTGAYTVNDFIVQAKALTITGTNGAKGSVVYFKVVLTDEQTNAFSDIVQSGTNAILSHFRATSVFTNISAPTCAVVTAF